MARKSRKQGAVQEVMCSTIYKTAIYARLSRESEQSEKIETQIEEVKEFIENKEILEEIELYEKINILSNKNKVFISSIIDLLNKS